MDGEISFKNVAIIFGKGLDKRREIRYNSKVTNFSLQKAEGGI